MSNNNYLVNDCLKLGFGMMRLPRVGVDSNMYGPIDIERTKKMVDDFISAGGKYFDTAFIYEGSEEAVKKALCDRYPRKSFYLATKLNAAPFACKNAEEAKAQLQKSLEKTGAGYFDFYLLHGVDAGNLENYDKFGIWDFVREAKEKGTVKHIGQKWKLPILWYLHEKPNTRYNELKRRVSGITNLMLTKSLRELEEARLVKRQVFSTTPPKVEYSLTDNGRDLLPTLNELYKWGEAQMSFDSQRREK